MAVFRSQSIVFDLFHTIADPDDFKPPTFSSPAKIAEIFGLDAKDFARYWEETSRLRNTSRSRKPLDLVEDYVTRNRGRPPTRGDLLMIDTFLGRYYDMALANPKSEVVVALHNLKYNGLKLCIVANVSEREVSTWYRSPLSGLFDFAQFSYEVGYEIPSKEAFSGILGKMGSSPASAVYVSGGVMGDLHCAKELGFGMTVLMEGFLRKHRLKSEPDLSEMEKSADACIQRISELEETLLRVAPTASS